MTKEFMQTESEFVLAVTNLDSLGLDQLPSETNLSKLLRFPFGFQETALLPLEEITEIIRVNLAEILPVPEMPSCVLGICNWRGEMLWLLDLNHLVGYSPFTTPTAAIVIVVKVNEEVVGLVVPYVDDIELHDLQQLQKAAVNLFPPKILPFISGALPDGSTVLNITAITQYPLWKIHHREMSSRS